MEKLGKTGEVGAQNSARKLEKLMPCSISSFFRNRARRTLKESVWVSKTEAIIPDSKPARKRQQINISVVVRWGNLVLSLCENPLYNPSILAINSSYNARESEDVSSVPEEKLLLVGTNRLIAVRL